MISLPGNKFVLAAMLSSVLLGVSVLVPLPAISASSGISIWPATTTPRVAADSDGQAIEVGVKFRSDVNGSVTGVRFYKGASNTGTHVASLWTRTGTRLATANFANETASGWQEVSFPTPVAITANTTYVASYYSPSGYFALNEAYFTAATDAPPLHALKNGTDGGNGVYKYGAGGFPTLAYNANNYWVDVVFSATATPDTTAPTVTAFTIPATAATLTVAISSFTATDNVGVTGYLVTESATAPAPSAGGWSAAPPTSYTFTSAGNKTLYAWAKDAAGNVSAGRSDTVVITLVATGPEPAGWYAGDMHVHRSGGGTPLTIESMYQKMSSQNLTIISLLADMGNGEVLDPVQDLPRVTGQNDPVSTPNRIVHWDAEWHWDPTEEQYSHQALGGHLVVLGVTEAHQAWEEYTYPIFNWAHQRGGIAGFAHMQYLDNTIPQSLTCCTPLEYPVEVALGTSDFIAEDVADNSFVSPPSWYPLYPEAAIQAYYRLLNCGFRPGLAAGTDYPFNNGAALGSLLTYVQIPGGQMTYRSWIDGIANGRTVISRNGHNEFLELKVNGSASPGDEIALTGGGSVPVTIQWTAKQSLTGTIELVRNGVVVASKQASASSGAPASLSATVDFAKSGWLAARRMGNNGHQLHTAAVFVTVDSAPVRASVADAEFYVQWMDNLLEKTSPGGAWSSFFVNSRSPAQARYQSAKALYQQIALEAAVAPTEPTIFTSQTPTLYENDAAYELGTRFWADVNGQISQVRIYTNATEGGTHAVRIWRARDATVVGGPYSWNITSGTAGWKNFTLPVPVTIAANTDYIVAVANSSDHYYAEQVNGFAAPIVNGNLHTYVGSGVYAEVAGTMPTAAWQNTNYFRDVLFVPQK